eukprot:s5129_g5.t1
MQKRSIQRPRRAICRAEVKCNDSYSGISQTQASAAYSLGLLAYSILQANGILGDRRAKCKNTLRSVWFQDVSGLEHVWAGRHLEGA